MAKFTVSNGVLLLDGAPCAEIGVNAYSLGEKTWGIVPPDNAYLTSFPLIKSYGYNVVRIMAGPFGGTGTYGWGNVVGTTAPSSWNDLNAGYRSKIDAIMDAAGDAGLTVLPSCLWNYQAIPDMLSESYADAFTPGSASIAYWEAFAYYFADHFKNHQAYGAHIPFNEWYTQKIVGFSAGGAPVYSGWSSANVLGAAEKIWAAMRSADPSRCVIPGSIAPPKYNDPNQWEWLRSIDDSIATSGTADALDWHVYLTSNFTGEKFSASLGYGNFVGIKDLLSEARRRAASQGKAFVCSEFGVAGDQDVSSSTKIQDLVGAIKGAGVQLALMWDWNPRTSLIVPSQDRWSVYPGYVYNGYARGDNYLSVVTNENVNPSAVNSPSLQLPKRAARFAGTTNNGITIPASTRYSSEEFTVMAWVRMKGRPANFSRMAQYRNAAASAGWILLFDTGANFPYLETRTAAGTSAYNTAGAYGRKFTDRWYHMAISYSDTSAQLFLDGREFRYLTYTDKGWAKPDNSTPLCLGFDGTSGWARIDMAEFGLFNRLVSAQEIYDYVFSGARPDTPVGWWPLQNNANDDSGFNNHGTALSGITYIDTVSPRATIASPRAPRS